MEPKFRSLVDLKSDHFVKSFKNTTQTTIGNVRRSSRVTSRPMILVDTKSQSGKERTTPVEVISSVEASAAAAEQALVHNLTHEQRGTGAKSGHKATRGRRSKTSAAKLAKKTTTQLKDIFTS
jgi:hypothetical protein